MSRIYSLSGVHNFRDFGDYAAAGGQHVAGGKLFRSANLNRASADALAQIEPLGINLIVDLRYRPERERAPNLWPDSQTPNVFEFPDPLETLGDALAPHEMFIQQDLKKAEDARSYMQSSYAARPDDPGFRKIFADTLRFMARTGDPILIHCAAGKDRTGTLAAIILSALDVDADTIMQDYLLTMEAVDVESFLQPAADIMRKKFGRPYDPNALRPMFGVEESYLENSLEAIGDMDSYIHDVLGISEGERTAIRRQYLSKKSA